MAILGIHHTGLVVPDLGQALEFYSGILGFEPVRKQSIEVAACPEETARSGSATGQLLRAGWGYLELIEFENPVYPDHQFFWTPVNKYGIRHISLMVEDALEAYGYLRNHMIFHGVPVRHSVESADNDAWSAYMRDPFGNVIELWRLGEEDPQPFAPVRTPFPGRAANAPAARVKNGILGLHHVAVVVPDLEKAWAFYHDVLGFERVQIGPIEPTPYAEVHTQLEKPDAVSYVFNTGWGYLEVWEYRNPVYPEPQPPVRPCNKYGFSHFTLMVDDCRAEYERLKDQVAFRGQPVGAHGDAGTALLGGDPFGNAIEFWQLGEEDPPPFTPAVQHGH